MAKFTEHEILTECPEGHFRCVKDIYMIVRGNKYFRHKTARSLQGNKDKRIVEDIFSAFKKWISDDIEIKFIPILFVEE